MSTCLNPNFDSANKRPYLRDGSFLFLLVDPHLLRYTTIMIRSRSGFTIVELLIVIVVIAILATISVVAYTGIQNRAHDSAVQNDLSNLRKIVEIDSIDTNGYYPYNLPFKATKSSYAVSPTTTYNLNFCVDYLGTNNQIYGVVALSKSGKIFYITNTHGVREYTGTWLADYVDMCAALSPSYNDGLRGYAASDTTNGPWRSWTGGN